MSYPTQQAERALIGALLTDNPPPLPASDITADDFANPGLREAFTTITDLRAAEPDLGGQALITATAHYTNAPGLNAEALTRLRDECPDPDHVLQYAQMVSAAGFHRRIADHAHHITTTTQPAEATRHWQALADAITRQAGLYLASETPQTSPNGTANSRLEHEEAVLTGLLQYPEQAVELARILPPESFTSPQRRDIYEATIAIAEAGDPVDHVIVAWHLDATRAYRQLADTGQHPAQPTSAYLDHLAGKPVTVDSALTAAQRLIADDVKHELAQTIPTAEHHPRAERNQQAAPLDPRLGPPQPAQQPQPIQHVNGNGGGAS